MPIDHVLAAAGASWDLVSDLRQLTTFPFMVNALRAGAITAIAAGAVGWFMVLRRETFAGHTLSVIAFPGAAAATLAGAPLLAGYYGACALGAVVLARIAGGATHARARESAPIGTVQAFALGLGFLFVSLYSGALNDLDALLFGTFLGVTTTQVLVLALVAAAALAVLAAIARPLLFASVDEEVARANGVPVGALSLTFLLVLALAVAATAQIVGALLVFALLVTPAATAQVLTPRPVAGLLLSVALSVAVVWLGLAIAYFTIYPVGFCVTSLSFGAYVLARLARRDWRRIPRSPRAWRHARA